ncbi:MAG TPA: ABC transporter ATP-binding protein [Bacteroidota bacterium]|nr:ABC transporter ATP-binding protein [Bacteroidota bacterium]
MNADAIVLDNLVKVFQEEDGGKITAVNRLSLRIKKGEIFSLVGPDGAGKTTTIRMMCGVLPVTEGTITLLGLDMKRQREEIKSHIGYLSQKFSLYGDLTIDENIDFFAEIHRVRDFKARKEELLQFTRLAPFRDRLAARLSGGMKQKLALACTLVHTPDIIFLDEPTTGVDPVSRRDFWKILSTLLKSGITIVVTTPYLDEAERSSRVALISEGTLLMCDTPERVKNSFGYDVFEVICQNPRGAAEKVRGYIEKKNIQLFGDRLHLLQLKGRGNEEFVKTQLQQQGLSIQSVRRIAPSLEDVFVSAIS